MRPKPRLADEYIDVPNAKRPVNKNAVLIDERRRNYTYSSAAAKAATILAKTNSMKGVDSPESLFLSQYPPVSPLGLL